MNNLFVAGSVLVLGSLLGPELPAPLGKPLARPFAWATPSATPAQESAAQRQEGRTVAQGTAERRPGETDRAFLQRVLPVSFSASTDLLAYAWRPSAYGKQLLFSAPASPNDYYHTNLFVLDPFQATTYGVQRFDLAVSEDCDEAPILVAVFFADLNQDGQKELLALASCSSREPAGKDADGVGQFAHQSHYATLVYQYTGLSGAGVPRYRLDATRRPYLQNLATVAAVRRALARHAPKATPAALAKPAPAAK